MTSAMESYIEVGYYAGKFDSNDGYRLSTRLYGFEHTHE